MAEPLFFKITKKPYHINKPIRLIELFAGYNAVHGTSYNTCDIKDVHAKDLKITETDTYSYEYIQSTNRRSKLK